jgi:hypothetical protein
MRATMKRAEQKLAYATDREVDRFEKAARRYVARVTKSKGAARRELVKLGIYTKSGRLSAGYKQKKCID